MTSENPRINSILSNIDSLIITGEVTNFVDSPRIMQGRRIVEISTFFVAAKRNLYTTGALNKALQQVHAQILDANRAESLVQGSGRNQSVRFGYLYTHELLSSQEGIEKNTDTRMIHVRLYPNRVLGRFLADYHQTKSNDKTAYNLRLESLTHGMMESDLVKLKRNPEGFIKSLKV